MKKVLSLILVLAVVLTTVGMMGAVSVSAAENPAQGTVVYTESFLNGVAVDANGDAITKAADNWHNGVAAITGLNEGFSVTLGEGYKISKDSRIPSFGGKLTVFLDSGHEETIDGKKVGIPDGNSVAIGFPEITEGKASVTVTMASGSKKTNQYFGALADTTNGKLNTVIAPLKRGYNGTNSAKVLLDIAEDNQIIIHEGKDYQTYTYNIDMTARTYEIEHMGVSYGTYPIPEGAKVNSLWFNGDDMNCNGFNVDKLVVAKYGADSTVTFKGANGEGLGTVTVSGGKVIGTVPAAPEIEGKIFYGWADSNGNVYENIGRIDKDTTVTAAYTDNKTIEDFETGKVVETNGVYSVTGLKPGFSIKFGDEYNPKNSSQTTKMPPSISGGKFSTKMSSGADNAFAINFPEVTEGKASIAITIMTGGQTQIGHFAALADTREGVLYNMIAPLKRGKNENANTDVWLDGLTGTLYHGQEYQTYIYNIDLTGSARTYSLEYNGAIYGPYDIPEGAKINSLWFDNANSTDNTGFSIDTIEFTRYERDAKVTFKNIDGTKTLGEITISGGHIIGNVPNAPYVEGKAFTGWVDASGNTVLNFADITKDTVLKANYVDKYITETFDTAAVTVNAETEKVGITTQSGFEFVLGSGKFQGSYRANSDPRGPYGDVGAGIKVTENTKDYPEKGMYLQTLQYTKDDSVAVKFPAVTSGTFAISFDGRVGTRTQSQTYFGTLACVEDDGTVENLIDVKRGRAKVGAETANVDGVWLTAGKTSYRMSGNNAWHTYKYIVDMTNKKYAVMVDNELIAENLDLPNGTTAANALWFKTINDMATDQQILIDNISIEYGYGETVVADLFEITDATLSDGNIVVSYGLNANGEGYDTANITGTPIAAVYKDGVLQAVTFDKNNAVTLTKDNATATISVAAPSDWETNEADYTVKVFIWNAGTIAPMVDVAAR